MRKKLYSLFVLSLISMLCFAQQIIETNLFEWSNNGSVIAKPEFIELGGTAQPSLSVMYPDGYNPSIFQSYTVNSLNNTYICHIQICAGEDEEEDRHHMYEHFVLMDGTGVIFIRFGTDAPLTTTRWLSGDKNDNNYFRKIDLNNDSYALIFGGWLYGEDNVGSEMIIVVVSKNIPTLVYDGYALATSMTNFNSNSFSMDFVKDITGLVNQNTGLLEITAPKLSGRTKYRLYKQGNMLKLKTWQY